MAYLTHISMTVLKLTSARWKLYLKYVKILHSNQMPQMPFSFKVFSGEIIVPFHHFSLIRGMFHKISVEVHKEADNRDTKTHACNVQNNDCSVEFLGKWTISLLSTILRSLTEVESKKPKRYIAKDHDKDRYHCIDAIGFHRHIFIMITTVVTVLRSTWLEPLPSSFWTSGRNQVPHLYQDGVHIELSIMYSAWK